MIKVIEVSQIFADKKLFESINLTFRKGNNYGVIGANGAGKSTFLKILSKSLSPTSGEIIVEKDKRISVLEQDQNKYDDFEVTEVVIMGHKKLYEIGKEKDIIYLKEDFDEQDGIKAAELEAMYGDMGGYEAESDAQKLLASLGIEKSKWNLKLKDLKNFEKIKVLLAKALFGNPDILILDEPTNHLDLQTIAWLEEFLINYNQIVIVVSHDTLFLDKISTHIVDIDFHDIRMFVGNYSFWKKSSELIADLMKKRNTKQEEKVKKLENFIAKFSANASKSKQATSRKKLLNKISIEDIKPSSRKYPYINFDVNKNIGKQILTVNNLKILDEKESEILFENINFSLKQNDKMVILGEDDKLKTKILEILYYAQKKPHQNIEWGKTVSLNYMPSNIENNFDGKKNLLEWIWQWDDQKDEQEIRSFLGKMLFSANQVFKKTNVISGGEKVRLMIAKMMLEPSNFLFFDQPLNHLDTESIDSFIKAMKNYESNIIFTSYNKTLISKVANVFLYIGRKKWFIFKGTFEEFSNNENTLKINSII